MVVSTGMVCRPQLTPAEHEPASPNRIPMTVATRYAVVASPSISAPIPSAPVTFRSEAFALGARCLTPAVRCGHLVNGKPRTSPASRKRPHTRELRVCPPLLPLGRGGDPSPCAWSVWSTQAHTWTLLDMSTERVPVSLPEDVRRASQSIADECGLSLSAVVAEALTGWLRARLVDAWLAGHQAEHGAFDESELRALAGEVGVPYLAPGRTEEPTA